MATNDESIKKNISRNITKYREMAGLSQKELASKLEVTPSRVSNWEQGANCPTIDILFKVCKILNVSINDVYGVYPNSSETLSYEELSHIKKYRTLDPHGKDMVDTVLDKEYIRIDAEKKVVSLQRPDKAYLDPVAAHDRTDIEVSDEMRKNDDDIMDDDDFWKDK